MPCEILRSPDGQVAKFIHNDGSETVIKCVPSQSTVALEDGSLATLESDRQKYSLFISASAGCYMRCSFCQLTQADFAYRKLSPEAVLANLKEALSLEVAARPDLATRYIKICWMGMGDALNQPQMVHSTTLEFLDWVMANGYALGVDSVDLSTVVPPVRTPWLSEFALLNIGLQRFPHNPAHGVAAQTERSDHQFYPARSSFRLFYSLHSAVPATRDRLVPGALPLDAAVSALLALQAFGVDILIHQVFLAGENDTLAELAALRDFLEENFPDNELRVLRYNACPHSAVREGVEVVRQLRQLLPAHTRIKVQQSAGSAVNAACGQFHNSAAKTANK